MRMKRKFIQKRKKLAQKNPASDKQKRGIFKCRITTAAQYF